MAEQDREGVVGLLAVVMLSSKVLAAVAQPEPETVPVARTLRVLADWDGTHQLDHTEVDVGELGHGKAVVTLLH